MGDLLCTYESEKAIVRIHSGKRTAEERKEAIENACKDFFLAIEKQNPGYFDRRISNHGH